MTNTSENRVAAEVVQDKKNMPVTRTRWLTLTTHAPIRGVQFANYLRFGPRGVRRFGPNTQENHPTHPHTLNLQLTLKRAVSEILLEEKNFLLKHPKAFDLEGANIWYGEAQAAHLRVVWVWDFYRLFGGFKLAVEVPPSESEIWQATVEKMRNIRPGDQIIVGVESRSGNILQVYPIDHAAFEQEF